MTKEAMKRWFRIIYKSCIDICKLIIIGVFISKHEDLFIID